MFLVKGPMIEITAVTYEFRLLRLDHGLPVKTRTTTTATITAKVRPTIKITLWSIGNAIRFFSSKAETLWLIFDLVIALRLDSRSKDQAGNNLRQCIILEP